MPEKVVITGGYGCIGSHLAEALLEKGFQITVFDNMSTGREQNLHTIQDRIGFIRGDIRRYQELEKALADATYVFHMAALSYVEESLKIPETYDEVNITGTYNVLKACAANSVKRFFFPSTCMVYGNPPLSPTPEDAPLQPTSPYGLGKVFGEYYAHYFFREHGIETVVLRLFNVYGPRMHRRAISNFAERINRNERPVVTGDGTQERDFIFMSDIVRAFLKAMNAGKQACGKSYNIGTGTGTSVNDLIEKINQCLNQNVPIRYVEQGRGEVNRIIADTRKAENELGFSTQVTLDDGLRMLFESERPEPRGAPIA